MLKSKIIWSVMALTLPVSAYAAADIDVNAMTIDRISRSATPEGYRPADAPKPESSAKAWNLGEKLTEGNATATSRIPAKNTPGKARYGTLVSKDMNRNGRIDSNIMRLINNAGKDSIDGIFSQDCKVAVTIDAQNGSVSIPAQQVFTHQTYGPIYICPVTISDSGMTYSKTGSIAGTIDDQGNISIGAWGVFVVEGSSAGGSFGIYTSSRFMPANAKVRITMSDNQVVNSPAHIEQTADNELMLYNFAGTGSPVKGRISPSRQIKVDPQYIATYGQYGDFYLYAADWGTNKVNLSTALTGTGTEKALTFGGWVVGTNHNCNQIAVKALKSELTLEEGTISYPKASAPFSGQGTEGSPYLIKTAGDLVALSQNVDAGESYEGKYFRLDTDIDMAGSTSAFHPIGDLTSPFNGVFDGAGHTIKNLRIDGAGTGNAGLFGYTQTKSAVRNLTVAAASVTGKGHYLGTITGTNYGTIDNCHVSGSLSGESLFMGGITGAAWGYVTNCTFRGNVSTIGIAGGIAGTSFSHIENCHTDAAMTVTGYIDSYYHDVAGISGVATKGVDREALITGCSFAGTLSDTGGYGYVAGIVSKALNVKIEKCFNVGAISAVRRNMETDTYAGGIVAWCNKNEINDCFNAGTIVKSGLSSEGVGGIAGYISIGYNITGTVFVTDKSSFINCYNSGQITSSNTTGRKGIYGSIYVREGFTADPTEGFFTACYNDFQATGMRDDRFNITTSELTSGSLPKGYDPSVWTANAGRYPLLKVSATRTSADLASAALILQDRETVVKVKKNMTLSSPSTVGWTLYNNGYVQETAGLRINGNTLELKDAYSNDVLAARLDEGHIKMWRISVIPNLFEGEGTAEVPYLIRNVQDLAGLNSAVTKYAQSHEGDYFKMTQDIDLNYSENFSGVGIGSNTEFKGIFDGDGHTISRLKIHSANIGSDGVATTAGSKTHAGLFSRIGTTGVVKNVNIAADADFIFYQTSGAIAGSVKGQIINCRNYAEVKGVDFYIGGIAGQLEASGMISGCYNSGKVIAGGYGAGGIVGRAMGDKTGFPTIELCQNDGFVSADYYNDLRVKLIHREAGGIAGYNYGLIRNCLNQGHVKSLHTVGGITGANSSNWKGGSVISCVSTGTVNVVNDDAKRGGISGTTTAQGSRAYNYYDCSAVTYGAAENAAADGITPLATASLISGTPLEGLDPEIWQFSKGMYPVLKAFADEKASAAMRSVYMHFDNGDTRLDLPSGIKLNESAGTVWKLRDGMHFSISGGALGFTLPSDSIMVTDTLTASNGELFKEYAVQAVRQFFAGKGTEKDPYLISSPADLKNLALAIAGTGFDYGNRYFKVTADIDCGNDKLTPIATGNNRFQGTIDGNGKNITFRIEDTNSKTGVSVGLFGTLGGDAVISDLTLTPTMKANNTVGAFAGKLYGTLRNCINKGTIASTGTTAYAAGLVGRAYSGAYVADCRNEGKINATGTYSAGIAAYVERKATISGCENRGEVVSTKNYAAGIAGRSNGLLSRCINTGKLQGAAYLAGIVASLDTAGVISLCENRAEINVSNGINGAGIVASMGTKNKGRIYGCVNNADVTAQRYAAGIACVVRSGMEIDSCINHGDVVSLGNYAGGVIGEINGETDLKATATRCFSTGSVKGGEQYAGGFCGRVSSNTYVADCYSTGDVTSVKGGTAKTYITGGFAGFCGGDLYNCWSSGNVDAQGYAAGGFLGYLSGGSVKNCFSLGNVKAAGNDRADNFANAGGFIGYCSNTDIENVYSMGSVEAPDHAGGLAGCIFSSTKIRNAYTISRVKSENSTSVSAVTTYSNSSVTDANTVLDNVYYISEGAPALSAADKRCKGVDRAGLIQADLGEAYHLSRGAYPVIATTAEPALAHYAAAGYEFWTSTDKESNLTDNLYVGNHGTERWTPSEHFVIKDGVAFPVKLGEGTLTLTSPDGDDSRVFRFNITKVSGVESAVSEAAVVSRQYIDMQGRTVAHPQAGEVYVVRTQHDDGTFTVEKRIFND